MDINVAGVPDKDMASLLTLQSNLQRHLLTNLTHTQNFIQSLLLTIFQIFGDLTWQVDFGRAHAHRLEKNGADHLEVAKVLDGNRAVLRFAIYKKKFRTV